MTKELVEEARQEASIHDKLGDGFSEGSEERAFYYAHRDRYKRLADALEAATRERAAVPDALERGNICEQERSIEQVKRYMRAAWSVGHTATAYREESGKTNLLLHDDLLNVLKRLEDVEAERDDLATRLSEYLCDSTGGLLSKTGYDVRTMVAHTEEYYDRVHAEERKEVEAERDDALAVLERIRQAVAGHPKCDRYEEDDAISCGWKSAYASVVWALDGAPEPEWEWAVRESGDDEPFSDVYQTREHLAENETGIAWGEEQLVRRRKAGPWLPVEGEKP